MNYYLDISLLPDAEIGLHFLWEKVFQQIHLGLAAILDGNGRCGIGVGLPAYDSNLHTLGNKLRLFAESAAVLEGFNARHCLSRLSDYVHVTGVRPVPERVKSYGCFFRIQPKSNKLRLARRKAKHEKISVEQALARLDKVVEQRTDAPFVWMKSLSSGERFRLFVGFAEAAGPSCLGFNAYGLSRNSTVPIF